MPGPTDNASEIPGVSQQLRLAVSSCLPSYLQGSFRSCFMGFIHPKCFQDVIFSDSETWRNTFLGIWAVQRGWLDQEWSCKQMTCLEQKLSRKNWVWEGDASIQVHASVPLEPIEDGYGSSKFFEESPALMFQLQRYSLLQPTSTNPIPFLKSTFIKGLIIIITNSCQTSAKPIRVSWHLPRLRTQLQITLGSLIIVASWLNKPW